MNYSYSPDNEMHNIKEEKTLSPVKLNILYHRSFGSAIGTFGSFTIVFAIFFCQIFISGNVIGVQQTAL